MTDPQSSTLQVQIEKQLNATFQKNLQVLRIAHPELHKQVMAFEDAPSYTLRFETKEGRFSNIQVMFKDGSSRRLVDPAWLKAVTLNMREHFGPKTVALLIGAGLGHELLTVQSLTKEADPYMKNMKTPVYIVERDMSLFRLLLQLHDLRDLFFEQRMYFFIGTESYEAFRVFLKDNGVRRPDFHFMVHSDDMEESKAFIESINTLVDDHNASRQLLHVDMVKYYETRPLQAWRDVYHGRAERKPRVVSFTSRYSTFLQYCMRDLLAGFRANGWEARLIIESDDTRTMDANYIIEEMAGSPPDLFLMIDHFRWESGTLIPPELPVVSWIQDILPNVTDAKGSPLTPRDHVFSLSSHWITDGTLSIHCRSASTRRPTIRFRRAVRISTCSA